MAEGLLLALRLEWFKAQKILNYFDFDVFMLT